MGPANVPQRCVVVKDVSFDPPCVHLQVALYERVADVVCVEAQEILQVAVVEKGVVLVTEEVGVKLSVLFESAGICFFDLRAREPDGRDLVPRLALTDDIWVGVDRIFGRRLY